MRIEVCANLGGDRKSRWYGQSKIAHLGEVRALAAEQILHAGFAIGLAVAEGVHPFCDIAHPPDAALRLICMLQLARATENSANVVAPSGSRSRHVTKSHFRPDGRAGLLDIHGSAPDSLP